MKSIGQGMDEALKVLEEELIDLVITDIPIVVLSGKGSSTSMEAFPKKFSKTLSPKNKVE